MKLVLNPYIQSRVSFSVIQSFDPEIPFLKQIHNFQMKMARENQGFPLKMIKLAELCFEIKKINVK